MMPGMNPKQMAQAMKAMGIKTTDLDADEVIIKGSKTIVVKNAKVTEIDMKGVKTFQVVGDVEELGVSDDDVALVAEKAGCDDAKARKALEETGDIAEAIIKLQGD